MVRSRGRITILRSLLVLAVVGLCRGEVAAQSVLRWKFQQGEKLHCTRTQNKTIQTTAGDALVKESIIRVTEMTLLVSQVDEDGTAHLTESIDRIRYKKTSPSGNVSYDSDSNKG